MSHEHCSCIRMDAARIAKYEALNKAVRTYVALADEPPTTYGHYERWEEAARELRVSIAALDEKEATE